MKILAGALMGFWVYSMLGIFVYSLFTDNIYFALVGSMGLLFTSNIVILVCIANLEKIVKGKEK